MSLELSATFMTLARTYEHELRLLCGPRGSFEEIDWFLDFHSTIHSSSLKKVYTKLIALCDPIATGLRPELVERIKTYPARCQEKQKREEEEKHRKWEDFLVAYNEMCRLARAHTPRTISRFEAFQRWWTWNFPFTSAQHQTHDRRQSRIEALIDWVKEGLREFHADDGQTYLTPEMAVMTKLWFESPFDRRLIALVTVHLLCRQWRDIESAVAAAVDEFEY